jgi:hypothetical protein
MVTRGLVLLCAVLALVPGASKGQGAQPNASPKAAPGVSLTPPPPLVPVDPTLSDYLRVVSVRILQQTGGGNMAPIEYGLTPNCDKPISAWGLRFTAHYSDGSSAVTSASDDELDGTYMASLPGHKVVRVAPWGGHLVKGEVRPGRNWVRGNSGVGSLVSVDGQVTAVVFLDRTARGDSSVIQQIAAARKAEGDERAAFLGNLRAALKDSGVREALAQRSTGTEERFRAAYLAQPQPPNDPGKSLHRAAELDNFARALGRDQALFDFLLKDREMLQAMWSEHSALKEEK